MEYGQLVSLRVGVMVSLRKLPSGAKALSIRGTYRRGDPGLKSWATSRALSKQTQTDPPPNAGILPLRGAQGQDDRRKTQRPRKRKMQRPGLVIRSGFVMIGQVFLAAARRAAAQPSLFTCGERPMASASEGTGWVMQEPAPTYAPLPMLMGATRVESEPTNTPSPMVVVCLCTPS